MMMSGVYGDGQPRVAVRSLGAHAALTYACATAAVRAEAAALRARTAMHGTQACGFPTLHQAICAMSSTLSIRPISTADACKHCILRQMDN